MRSAKYILRDMITNLKSNASFGESMSITSVDGNGNTVIGASDSVSGTMPPAFDKHHFVVGHPIYGSFPEEGEECPWVL